MRLWKLHALLLAVAGRVERTIGRIINWGGGRQNSWGRGIRAVWHRRGGIVRRNRCGRKRCWGGHGRIQRTPIDLGVVGLRERLASSPALLRSENSLGEGGPLRERLSGPGLGDLREVGALDAEVTTLPVHLAFPLVPNSIQGLGEVIGEARTHGVLKHPDFILNSVLTGVIAELGAGYVIGRFGFDAPALLQLGVPHLFVPGTRFVGLLKGDHDVGVEPAVVLILGLVEAELVLGDQDVQPSLLRIGRILADAVLCFPGGPLLLVGLLRSVSDSWFRGRPRLLAAGCPDLPWLGPR